MKNTPKALGDFLEKEFLKFEIRKGRRCSQQEFANWLEVRQPTLSTWMRGLYEPSPDSIRTLADKIGPQIYEALGMQIPDCVEINTPLMRRLWMAWYKLSDDDQKRILEDVEEAAYGNRGE